MNLDNLWKSIEESESASTVAEILAWAYFNSPDFKIKHIQQQFDSWTLEDFEHTLDSIEYLPSIEGESYKDVRFAVDEWTSRIEYYEGSNLTFLPEFFWFNLSSQRRKSNFF